MREEGKAFVIALVEEYLRRFDADGTLESERQLSREDLPPAQRLLAIFDPLEETLRSPPVVRGCPFHNAADDARVAAATLLKAALHRPDGGGGQGPRSGD